MGTTIIVDPEKLKTAATAIKGQTEEYEKQYKALYTEVDNMESAWKGADNVAYTTQIKGFTDDFQNMIDLLKQYSEFLDSSAKTYKTTQDEIIAGAKKLVN